MAAANNKATFNIEKHPDAVLEYVFDLAPLTNGREGAKSDWLASGETITTYEVTVESGLAKNSDEKILADTAVKVWLAGGTPMKRYDVECKYTTSDNRTDARTLSVFVGKL